MALASFSISTTALTMTPLDEAGSPSMDVDTLSAVGRMSFTLPRNACDTTSSLEKSDAVYELKRQLKNYPDDFEKAYKEAFVGVNMRMHEQV